MEEEQQKEDFLYRGAQLATAQEIFCSSGELPKIGSEFLEASIAERKRAQEEKQREQRSRQRLLAAAAAVFALLAVVASVAAIFGFCQKGEAIRQRIGAKREADRAVTAERTANEQKIEAEKQKQLAGGAKVEAQAREKEAIAAQAETEKQKTRAETRNRELGLLLEEAAR
jgi:hypothetical protein